MYMKVMLNYLKSVVILKQELKKNNTISSWGHHGPFLHDAINYLLILH